MRQTDLTRFAKRLNVVLRHAGWPPAPYVGGPDPFLMKQPYSDVTLHVFRNDPLGNPDKFYMTIKRSDDKRVIRVEVSEDLCAARNPSLRIRNELIRRTHAALS